MNLSAAHLSFTFFSLVAFLLDPLTRFYNTVVLGSFVSAMIFFLPVLFGMKRFVVVYRSHVGTRIEKWKIYTIINRSVLVRWYTKIRDIGH